MPISSSTITSLLKKSAMVAGLCAVGLPCAANWKIENGRVLDPNGQPFIFRGVTIHHDHTIAPDKTVQAIKHAAEAGANSVQVEMSLDYVGKLTTGEQVRSIIQACKDNKVVCVLEPNNVAGYPDVKSGFHPLVSYLYWEAPGIRQAVAEQHDYVVFGLGNQALGSRNEIYQYLYNMEDSVQVFRERFPRFLLMIDGSHWGQDTNKAMHELAAKNIQNGTAQNLIYSVELFDAYADPEKVRDYIASFSLIGAPLVIGGFAPVPYYHPLYPYAKTPDLQLPAASVMQYAQQYSAGYFAWGWGGNSNPALDLTTDGNPLNLTIWGKLAFNDVNGIKATAKPATHFTGVRPNTPPIAAITASIHYPDCLPEAIISASGSSDPDGDTLTYRWELRADGQPVITATASTTGVFIKPLINYTLTLTVDDGNGGTATASKVLYAALPERCSSSSSSSSSTIVKSSSSSLVPSSSSKPSSTSSHAAIPSSISSRSSSSVATKAICSYIVNSQWGNGFTAAIRIKNTSTQVINGWSVNWQYSDATKVTSAWNATLSGSNPYSAKNQGWNASIQPGQTLEFGLQGSKPTGTAVAPVVSGGVCQ